MAEGEEEEPRVVLKATLSGRLVERHTGDGLRADAAEVVALDGVVSEEMRADMHAALVGQERSPERPPTSHFECSTADSEASAPTPGAKDWVLDLLEGGQCKGARELVGKIDRLVGQGARAELIPDCLNGDAESEFKCRPFLGNAPTADPREEYGFHVDADPSVLPESAWTRQHGRYCNREPGKPRLVSAIAFLNASWEVAWQGETIFMDDEDGVGVCVSPKPGRVILMDQDVLHRVSKPSREANKPRWSLVCKLALHPVGEGCEQRVPDMAAIACGSSLPVGSAHRLERAAALAKRMRSS